MYLFQRIKPIYFFLSFVIGLLVVYTFTPPPQIVVKFPTPQNAGAVVYKDTEDACYKYNVDAVSCPRDPELIRAQPLSL